MAQTVPFSYPLDPSGSSSANLVVNEVHTTVNRITRAVVTNYGAFFGDSMTVVDMATGLPLTGAQWYPAQLYEQPTLQYGSPIYSLIMITDATVSDQIAMTYQALGGAFSSSQQALVDYINNLDLDARPASWPAIINKPDGYTPDPHLHDVGDIYGFEYIVQSLDRLAYAIQVGDAASNDALLAYVDANSGNLAGELAALSALLNAHIANLSNPHQVTAAQLGVYTKTQSDANLATVNTTLTNSIGTVNTALTSHVQNIANPHQTNAAQVGAYTVAQTTSAIAAAGVTLSAATATVATNLSTHTANLANPHQTTAAQLGVYTTAQSTANLNAAIATVNTTITAVNNALVAHENNLSNPHQTSAAQLGVYTGAQSDAIMAANVNALTAQINTKAAASQPYAYTGINQTVTFWDVHANGTLFSANDVWAFNSDERLKCDFETIKNPLEMVMALGGYFHRYKPEYAALLDVDPEKTYVGVKAQEVQAQLPMITGLAPFDRDKVTGESISGQNFLTVQYDRLAPLFIESIKALVSENQSMQRQLRRLTRMIDSVPNGGV